MATQVADVTISPAERVRRQLAPVAASVASVLAVLSTASLAAIVARPADLPGLSANFVGVLALAATLTLASAMAALAGARSFGAGLPLSVGAAACAVSLAVGDGLVDASDLVFAAGAGGLAAGCLMGAAASLSFELPPRAAHVTTLVWMVPLVVGWPLQAWAAWSDDAAGVGLVVPFPQGLALLGVAVVLGFGILSAVLRPARAAAATSGWREAWLALAGALAVLCMLAMLVGFEARLHLFWLRPVVLVATALALAIWILVMMLVPAPAAKIAFLAVSFVGAAIVPTGQLLVVADSYTAGAAGSVASGLAVVISGLVGAWAGHRWPRRGVSIGLVAVAAVAVVAWPGYGSAWVAVPLLAMLISASTAAAAGGFTLALECDAALRLVSFAFISGLVTGLLVALPLGWALLGDLPLTAGSARANARVLLGLVFSAAVLVAAHSSVLGRRIDRRLGRERVAVEPRHR